MSEKWNDDGKRRYQWFLTENNHDWDEKQSLCNLTLDNWRDIRYVKLSEEIGEEGTPHVHAYIVLVNACTFSQVKQRFDRANIQPRFGSHQEAKDYIGREEKSGQVLSTWELGSDENMHQGFRSDLSSQENRLEELKSLIQAGCSLDDLYDMDFALMMRFGRELRVYYDYKQLQRGTAYGSGDSCGGNGRPV